MVKVCRQTNWKAKGINTYSMKKGILIGIVIGFVICTLYTAYQLGKLEDRIEELEKRVYQVIFY